MVLTTKIHLLLLLEKHISYRQLNTKIKEGRSASFDYMGGNITEVVGQVFGAVKSVAAGVLNSVNLSGVAALTGAAFVDVPEMWSGSTANLPTAEFTIPLPCPVWPR
jgi:hypothetical protein